MNDATQNRRVDFVALLKESAVAALVAFGLTVVMVGMKTVDRPGGLGLEYRFGWVATAVVSVFVGRFLLALWRETRPVHKADDKPSRQQQMMTSGADFFRKFALYFGLFALGFAIVMPFLGGPFSTRYFIDVATYVTIYIMLGWGLNIVVGLAGLLDLGYVAFYAVGAYSYALLSTHLGWSFWVSLPLAGMLAASFGMMLGFPVLRLRGDYLAIVTLGFGEIIRIILLNWYELTGGPDGISGIPRPSFFGLDFSRRVPENGDTFHTFFGLDYSSMHRIIFLYYLILALALMTNWFTLRIRKLPIGRAWEALREDEIACRSLGINPTNTKLTAFSIGAMFGGFAGSFFATRQGFISPESFTFIESAVILAIVVLGGLGSQIGVVVASVVLIGGTELFRGLEEYRMLTFGALMVAIMVWKPRGLFAFRRPTVILEGKKVVGSMAGEGSG